MLQRTVPDSRCEVAEIWLIHGFHYFLKYSYSLQESIHVHFFCRKKNSSSLNAPIAPHTTGRLCTYLHCCGCYIMQYMAQKTVYLKTLTPGSQEKPALHDFLGSLTLLRGNIQMVYDHAPLGPSTPRFLLSKLSLC